MTPKKDRRQRKRLIAAADVQDAAARLREVVDKCDKLAADMEREPNLLPLEYDGGFAIIDAVSLAIEWEGFIRAAFTAKQIANRMMKSSAGHAIAPAIPLKKAAKK